MNFNKYPKIETCFQRSLETKKLLDGVWRSDELQYLKDCEWIWTEKVDGTNIQIRWDGHRVEFGGRTERANIPQPLMDYLETTFGGEVNEEIFEQLFGETEVVLFGEGYGPKIQSGGGCYMEGLVGTPTVGLLRRNGERIQVKIKWNDFKEFVEE